jgi:cyclopropane-fatty-acyl-phospholipid synthase
MTTTTPRGADRRIEAAHRLLAELRLHAPIDIAVRLWNGEVVALGAGNPGDLCVALNTPAAITRLVRRPRLKTLIELVAEGAITLEGGTLLDLSARRGSARTKGLWRKLDKRVLLGALAPFLFARAEPAGAGHAYAGAQAATDAAGRDNRALVQFHYDLSNDFYALFLDPEMQYSCGYFPHEGATLAEAQAAKLEMICRKLRLLPGEKFLDIGCGWGGLVCHAAQHHGVVAHGVTLSQAQFEFVVAKIARLGLSDRITVELKDYRALTGSFDKIASIGMFEHVGLANAPTYFAHLHGLLRPRGLMLHHAITRPAKRDDRAFRRKRPEYQAIVDYIFPGSELDHIGNSVASIERAGFEVHDVEAWREHYARTTQLWCESLYARRDAAIAEVGAAKTRLWLLYLAGVSLGFQRGTIGIFQTLASKRARGASGLPMTRADLYR